AVWCRYTVAGAADAPGALSARPARSARRLGHGGAATAGSGPATSPTERKKRAICRRIRESPPGAVVLAEDATDVLLFPPVRAAWAERGREAEVRISGGTARRVIFGDVPPAVELRVAAAA